MLYYLSAARLPSPRAHVIQQVNMCQGFASAGESVTLVTCQHPTQTISREEFANYYGVTSPISLRTFPFTRRNRQVPIPYVPDLNHQLATYWLLFHQMRGTFSEDDIIYSRNPYPTWFYLRVLDAMPREVSRPAVWFEQHQVSRDLGRSFYELLDGLVTISEHQKRRFGDRYQPQTTPIFVAHDGVNLHPYSVGSKAEARAALDVEGDEALVVYTGHLYPSKGVETLVRAAKGLDARCLIVGGYDDDIERITEAIEIPPNMTFVGHVPPAEVHRYQLAADVLVATIATETELDYFSPLKFFEYMATGNPSVIPDRPEYEEIHTPGRTALTYEPGSVTSLTEAIRTLLDDDARRQEIGRRACESVQDYSWQRRGERILRWVRTGE